MTYHKVTKTREVDASYCSCDLCGNKSGRRNCSRCHRDICAGCTHEEYENGSDYVTRYCLDCWKAGEPFRLLIEAENRRNESELERIEAAYQAMCDTHMSRLWPSP